MGRKGWSHLTASAVAEALRQCGGYRSHAARMLDCAPSTITRFINRHPSVRQVLDDIEAELLDLAESNIVALLKQKDPTTTFFVLRTKGRERGWVEKNLHEHFGKDGGPIEQSVSHAVDFDIDPDKLSTEELETLQFLLTKATKSVPEGDEF